MLSPTAEGTMGDDSTWDDTKHIGLGKRHYILSLDVANRYLILC